jgi:tetratricopeptide (TPR) repeat protein
MSDRRSVALLLALSLTGVAPRALATPDVWRRSYALEARGDVRGALSAIEALPGDQRAGYLYALRHAWLLYLAGRHDESVAAYRVAAGASARAIEPRVGELLPLMALRRWQEAEQRAREVLRLDADNYLASRRLALALYQLGRFDDAREVYQQVSARYPGDLEMVTGSAWCDLRRGRRDEAATAFRTVLAVSPDDATAAAGLTAAQAR